MFITIDSDKRILRATYDEYAQESDIYVDALPTGETEKEKDITNYLYLNGEYIYSPLPDPVEPQEVDRISELEASVMYLSMMTGIDIPTMEAYYE